MLGLKLIYVSKIGPRSLTTRYLSMILRNLLAYQSELSGIFKVLALKRQQSIIIHGYASLDGRYMMTSSNGNIFRVTGPLCGEFTDPGEFTAQRPVTRSFDVFFDLRLNKQLSKQPWGWWFETPSWSLWRHCNVDGPWISQPIGY